MKYFNKLYLTIKGKRKYPWLYRREDILDDDISFSELCNKEFQENVETLIGEWVNKDYFILSFLGRGTFSLVYMAYSLSKKKFIVLKLILPCYNQEGKYECDIINKIIENNKDFQYSVFKWEKNPSIVCIEQPCYGIPIADLVKRDNYSTLPNDTIITFMYHCLLQINNLHKSNIIHTDIKLDNILSSYNTDYIKDIQQWFLSKDPHNWIYNHYEFNKSQNRLRKIKWSWTKCSRVARKKFKQYFMKEYSEFKKMRNDRIIAELENVKEVEDFDTYRTDFLAEVNIDSVIDMTEKPYAAIIDYGNALIDDEIEPEDICYENYRPPENMIRLEVSKKSDIWSLGCIFYEMLTGKYLFDFDSDYSIDGSSLYEYNDSEYSDNNYDMNDSSNITDSNDIHNKNIVKIYKLCLLDKQERFDNIKSLLIENSLFSMDDSIMNLITEVMVSMLDCDPNTRKNADEILKMKLFKPFIYDNLNFTDIDI